MYEKTEKSQQKGFIIISIMLFLFSVLKVIRGANTSIAREGGIWNYISLLYYVVVIFGIAKNRFLKAKVVFIAPLFYCVLAMLIALGSGNITASFTRFYLFLMVPYFFLVFVSFYFFSGNSVKAEKIILAAYLLCLFINAYTIIGFLIYGRNRAIASDIYYSLCLFPFALQLIKNKRYKITVVFAQFFITFLSNKRTGFIAVCIGLILYFLIESIEGDKKNFLKIIIRLLLIVASVILLYYVSTYIDNKFGFGIYNRLNRLEDDRGSGRGVMYSVLWREIRTSNWFNILFGHGMTTAGKVVGADYAHNDFLEVFYDYGFFAFICIVVYYISIIYYAIQMVIRKSPYAASFVFSVIIGLSLSLFSYFLIFYTFVTCIVAFWGYTIKLETERLEQLDTIKEDTQ